MAERLLTTWKSAADFAVLRSFVMALTVFRKAEPWKSNIFTAVGKGGLLLGPVRHLLFVPIRHLKPSLLSPAETTPSTRPSAVAGAFRRFSEAMKGSGWLFVQLR